MRKGLKIVFFLLLVCQVSVCIHYYSENNIMFFPTLTRAAHAKKSFAKAICSRHQWALSGFLSMLTYTELIAWLC